MSGDEDIDGRPAIQNDGGPGVEKSLNLDSPIFWRPTPMERIEEALDLAELRAGERLVDLRSGDGRVLLSAARRGARALGLGYELDPDLASQARDLDGGLVASMAVIRLVGDRCE